MAKNPRLIDLHGQRFGLWTVLSQSGNAPRGAALWLCKCECGTERPVIGADLRGGKSTNCGCVGVSRIGALRRTHASSGTRLHRIWVNMRKRCLNRNDPSFGNYGGRGIAICQEWGQFSAFHDWAINCGYNESLSIERLDVNGNYEPTNCIWATAQAQSENRRFVAKAPNGRLWVHIARENGVSNAAYRSRLTDGWDHHQAATWPMGKKRRERPRNAKGQYA
jgi:hypothetical protein